METNSLLCPNCELANVSNTLMSTYNRLPVTFSRGEGVWLEDQQGKRYLDALAGIAVCNLGHAHPRISETIAQQSQTLLHTSNIYNIACQSRLAEKLIAITALERVFFGNSGAEANECAIKIARMVGHQRGITSPKVVVMDGAFHGRTLATLSATANANLKRGFGPLLDGFYRVPFNDPETLRALSDHRDIVAVMVEPIQGEGGIVVPNTGYLKALRTICDQNNWLLILDEIQTGVGRTGEWYAFQSEGVMPDVLTSAKGLGNGVPIGACMARGEAAKVLSPGSHGSTFGGNPFCCAVALTVLETMEQEQLLNKVKQTGGLFLNMLKEQLADSSGVNAIRGRGLMIGIELDRPCGTLVERCLEAGLLINVTAGNTVRLLPPLIVDENDVAAIVDILVPQIQTFLAKQP